MNYLNVGIGYLFEYLITVSFCNSIMKKKMKYSKILLCTFQLCVAEFAVYFIFQNAWLNAVLSFLMFFLTMVIGYKEKTGKQIIYTFYLMIIMWLSETVFSLNRTIGSFLVAGDKNPENSSIIIVLGIKMLNLILVQLFVLVVKHRDFQQNKKIVPLFIYPVITMCLIMYFYYLATEYNFDAKEIDVFLVIIVVSSLMSVVIFIYYSMLNEQDKKLKELEKEQQFVELNDSYMQVLEHQNKEMQMVFHDTKHHYMAIENMDSLDDVKNYVSKLYPQLENKNHINISSNKMLDLLLNKYIVTCQSRGIKFNFDVKTVSLDYIDDSELSILICNILDNAVESAEKSGEKIIDLSLKRIGNMDLLSVENSCDVSPKHNENTLITSKTDGKNHGLGTKSIERYAKKNGGKYEWFYDENEKRFHLNILFNEKD